jgi:hypothetical protein
MASWARFWKYSSEASQLSTMVVEECICELG